MIPSTIFGLPAHALIVHVAVVLVPMAALALIAVGWRTAWRQQYAFAIAVIASAGAVAAFLAASTGGTLKRSIETAARAGGTQAHFADHLGQGNNAEFVAIIFAVTALSFWGIERWHTRFGLPAWLPGAAYAAAIIPAAAAIITMVLAGHSGATLVWKDLGTFAGSRT